jgi:PTS system galactitol-specific IIA component
MDLLIYYVSGTREDVLSFLSDKLRERNFVKDSYKRSLLEREKKHPTGLVLSDLVNVAIPHTDPEFANADVFVIGIPQNEVKFGRIDDPSVEIAVDLIFLFVIKDPNEYLTFLSKLTENFANKEFLGYIKERNIEKINAFLKEHVL